MECSDCLVGAESILVTGRQRDAHSALQLLRAQCQEGDNARLTSGPASLLLILHNSKIGHQGCDLTLGQATPKATSARPCTSIHSSCEMRARRTAGDPLRTGST